MRKIWHFVSKIHCVWCFQSNRVDNPTQQWNSMVHKTMQEHKLFTHTFNVVTRQLFKPKTNTSVKISSAKCLADVNNHQVIMTTVGNNFQDTVLNESCTIIILCAKCVTSDILLASASVSRTKVEQIFYHHSHTSHVISSLTSA